MRQVALLLLLLVTCVALSTQAQPVTRKIVPSLTEELKSQLALHNISECTIRAVSLDPPAYLPRAIVLLWATPVAAHHHSSPSCLYAGVLLVLPGNKVTSNVSLDWEALSRSLHRVDIIRSLEDFTAHWHKVHSRCVGTAGLMGCC